jgi:hypothetical protein
MSALFAQLARAVLQHPPHQQQGLKGSRPMGAAFSAGDAEGLPAPSPFIVQELRKALAAGWADQVRPLLLLQLLHGLIQLKMPCQHLE